jgi:hypothetical protein
MYRYVAAANAAAGKGWDNMLDKILDRDEVASAIRKDDMYNLANLGINDDWSVQAGLEIFARTPEEAEADGWERGGTAARVQLKSVAFVFDTMQEGMKVLRAWGVLKEDKGKDKENNPSLEWNVKGREPMKAFREVRFFTTYPSWMRGLAFDKVGKGQWKSKYLAAQGAECRKRGNALEQLGLDVKEAGLRSVIQWLVWLFGVPDSYNSTKELVSQIPQWARRRVIKALEDQACFGKSWDYNQEKTSVYVLQDECKMAVPIERDCRGAMPGIFAEWEKKAHRQVPRLERARKLGIHVEVNEVAVEKKEEEEEEENEDEGVDTWFRVLAAESYSVPKRVEIVEGLEKLFLREAGDFDGGKKYGVEIVWLQLPFPSVVEPKTDAYDKYNIFKESVVSQKVVEESVNLALSLLTEEGVFILVAPLGVPDWSHRRLVYEG